MFEFVSSSEDFILLKWDDDEGSARDMEIAIWARTGDSLSLWRMAENVSIHVSTFIVYNEMHLQRWSPDLGSVTITVRWVAPGA